MGNVEWGVRRWLVIMLHSINLLLSCRASPMTQETAAIFRDNSFSSKMFLREATESFCTIKGHWEPPLRRYIAPILPPLSVDLDKAQVFTYEECANLIAERYFSMKQAEFYALVPLMEKEINRRLEEIAPWEFAPLKYHLTGSILGYLEKYSILQSYANDERVETICEIGFNAGHSTLLMALNNPKAKFLSFDIFYHNYSANALAVLQDMYPDRDFLGIAGDSVLSVPRFHRRFPHERCNLIFIDGAHAVAILRRDIEHMSFLANQSYHRVLIDDTPEGYELYNEYREFTVIDVPEDIERNMYHDLDPSLKPTREVMKTCPVRLPVYGEVIDEHEEDQQRRREAADESEVRYARLRHIAQYNVPATYSPCFSWIVHGGAGNQPLLSAGVFTEMPCEDLRGRKIYDDKSGISVAEYLFQ